MNPKPSVLTRVDSGLPPAFGIDGLRDGDGLSTMHAGLPCQCEQLILKSGGHAVTRLHRSAQLRDAQIGREDTGWIGIEPGQMAVLAVAALLRIATESDNGFDANRKSTPAE